MSTECETPEDLVEFVASRSGAPVSGQVLQSFVSGLCSYTGSWLTRPRMGRILLRAGVLRAPPASAQVHRGAARKVAVA